MLILTPRNTIKAFFDLLAILDQNRAVRWEDLLEKIEIFADTPIANMETNEDSEKTFNQDDLSSFKL